MKRNKKLFFLVYYFAIPAIGLIYILCSIISLLPPSEIIILSGPKGGFFSTVSNTIKVGLAKENIKAHIRYVNNTSDIIKEVNKFSSSRPHIGFIAQNISNDSSENLFSLGKIATEPLWLFSSKSSDINSVNGLLGKIIAVGPQHSGVRVLSEKILGLYGVNNTNSFFVEEHLIQAKAMLKKGDIDAAFFLLPVNTPIIKELADNSEIKLIGFEEAEALSHTIKVIEKVIIPKGTFSISPREPEKDVTTVAIPVSVIVGDHAGIGLSVIVANILRTEFSKETFFAQDQVLPAFHYEELRPLPAAREIYEYGLPFITKIFGTKLGLVLNYAAQPLILTIVSFVLLLGIVITYTEIIPVLIQVRKLFIGAAKKSSGDKFTED
jgi:TRAP-type uncharacterized transport system substrate-binding protein